MRRTMVEQEAGSQTTSAGGEQKNGYQYRGRSGCITLADQQRLQLIDETADRQRRAAKGADDQPKTFIAKGFT